MCIVQRHITPKVAHNWYTLATPDVTPVLENLECSGDCDRADKTDKKVWVGYEL